MQELTIVQEEVYEFIKEYLVNNQTMPSVKDMAKEFNVADNAIQERLVRLEKKGYISMGEGKSRSITLTLHDIKLTKRRVEKARESKELQLNKIKEKELRQLEELKLKYPTLMEAYHNE